MNRMEAIARVLSVLRDLPPSLVPLSMLARGLVVRGSPEDSTPSCPAPSPANPPRPAIATGARFRTSQTPQTANRRRSRVGRF